MSTQATQATHGSSSGSTQLAPVPPQMRYISRCVPWKWRAAKMALLRTRRKGSEGEAEHEARRRLAMAARLAELVTTEEFNEAFGPAKATEQLIGVDEEDRITDNDREKEAAAANLNPPSIKGLLEEVAKLKRENVTLTNEVRRARKRPFLQS